MTLDQLMKLVLRILPDATFDEDIDGQIVIYTDMEETLQGPLRKVKYACLDTKETED